MSSKRCFTSGLQRDGHKNRTSSRAILSRVDSYCPRQGNVPVSYDQTQCSCALLDMFMPFLYVFVSVWLFLNRLCVDALGVLAWHAWRKRPNASEHHQCQASLLCESIHLVEPIIPPVLEAETLSFAFSHGWLEERQNFLGFDMSLNSAIEKIGLPWAQWASSNPAARAWSSWASLSRQA